MIENQILCAMYDEGLLERADIPPELWHKRRKRKPRPPTLGVALRKAKAKGWDVTIASDGSVTFKNIGGCNTTSAIQGDDTATAEDELAQWRKRKRDAHSG